MASQAVPAKREGGGAWWKAAGNKVKQARLFQHQHQNGDANGSKHVVEPAPDTCTHVAMQLSSIAPWLQPQELYEMMEIASGAIDRAPGVRYELEPQPVVGWRNQASQCLAKAWFYSPKEVSQARATTPMPGHRANV